MSKFYDLLNKMINRIKVYEHHTNLLDNSYFVRPVNQRNITGVFDRDDDASGRFLDRWILTEGAVRVDSDGITLHGSIRQTLNHEIKLASDTVLTACVGDDEGLLEGAASYDPSTRYFTITASEPIHIKWAALYEGEYTNKNMPMYIPKDYSAELFGCYRYYWRAKGETTLYGYATSDTSGYLFITLPCPVRKKMTPAVKLTGATLTIRTTDGKTHNGDIHYSGVTAIGNIIRIAVTGEGFVAQNVIVGTVNSEDGILEIIADY